MPRLSKRTRVFKVGGRGITTRGRRVGKGLRAYSPTRMGRAGKLTRARKH